MGTDNRTGQPWFEVDRKGLSMLLGRRSKASVVTELIQNAWDEDVTRVLVELNPAMSAGYYTLVVADDSPEGFADLTHAYTVFAPSNKKVDPTKRGRYNMGEKLVVALCERATIQTTKGTVEFREDGQRIQSSIGTEAGSTFEGFLRLSKKDADEILRKLTHLLPPEGITTVVNGVVLPERSPLATAHESLQTEVANEDGVLERTYRVTDILIYTPAEGEKPTIYEMGIPVVKNSAPYHVNVMQKIPLNMDRDNVTPSYAKNLNVAVLNVVYPGLAQDQLNQPWARQALGDYSIEKAAVQHAVKQRFGDRAVIFDPSDPEANKIAVSKGYQVVYGGAMSSDEWARVKDHELLIPAGKVTPSPGREQDAGIAVSEPLKPTMDMQGVAAHARLFATTAGIHLGDVVFVEAPDWGALASYQPLGKILRFNVSTLGEGFFKKITAEVDALILHELAHDKVEDHLSADFGDEVARLGALLARYYGSSSLHRAGSDVAWQDEEEAVDLADLPF